MVWCSMVTQGRLAPNATPTLIGDSLGITDVDDTDRDQLCTLGFSRKEQQGTKQGTHVGNVQQ